MATARKRLPEPIAASKLGRVERRIVRALAFLKRPSPVEMPESLTVMIKAIAEAQAAQVTRDRKAEED
jgi:hypothetical protein